MKKILLILVVLLISLSSFSYASQGENGSSDNDDWEGNSGDDYNEIPNRGEVTGPMPISGGRYMHEYGEELEIQELQKNMHRLRWGNASFNTSLNITQEMIQEKIRLHAMLSNGQNAEIKVMPDTASDTALARLRLRVCQEEEGCSIELKEVGDGVEAKLAYEVMAEKEAKVFGLFGTKMKVQAQVDAENGELIREHKPWWAFLASEAEE